MMLSFGLECTHAHTHTHLLLHEISYHWKKNWVTEDRVKVRNDFSQHEPFWTQNFELCFYITYMKRKYKWDFTQSDPFNIKETCGGKESLKINVPKKFIFQIVLAHTYFLWILFFCLLPLRCITALIKSQMFCLSFNLCTECAWFTRPASSALSLLRVHLR